MEVWLSEIQFNISETMGLLNKTMVHDIMEGGTLDELAFKVLIIALIIA